MHLKLCLPAHPNRCIITGVLLLQGVVVPVAHNNICLYPCSVHSSILSSVWQGIFGAPVRYYTSGGCRQQLAKKYSSESCYNSQLSYRNTFVISHMGFGHIFDTCLHTDKYFQVTSLQNATQCQCTERLHCTTKTSLLE